MNLNPFNFPKGIGPSPLDATVSFKLEVGVARSGAKLGVGSNKDLEV